MIEPTEADIGRGVVYQPPLREQAGMSPQFAEDGVITSFNEHYVFVRYLRDIHSKATKRDCLTWLCPEDEYPDGLRNDAI